MGLLFCFVFSLFLAVFVRACRQLLFCRSFFPWFVFRVGCAGSACFSAWLVFLGWLGLLFRLGLCLLALPGMGGCLVCLLGVGVFSLVQGLDW